MFHIKSLPGREKDYGLRANNLQDVLGFIYSRLRKMKNKNKQTKTAKLNQKEVVNENSIWV